MIPCIVQIYTNLTFIYSRLEYYANRRQGPKTSVARMGEPDNFFYRIHVIAYHKTRFQKL